MEQDGKNFMDFGAVAKSFAKGGVLGLALFVVLAVVYFFLPKVWLSQLSEQHSYVIILAVIGGVFVIVFVYVFFDYLKHRNTPVNKSPDSPPEPSPPPPPPPPPPTQNISATNSAGAKLAGGDIVGRDSVGGDHVGRDKIDDHKTITINNVGVPPEVHANILAELALVKQDKDWGERMLSQFVEILSGKKIPVEQWRNELSAMIGELQTIKQKLAQYEGFNRNSQVFIDQRRAAREAFEAGNLQGAQVALAAIEAEEKKALAHMDAFVESAKKQRDEVVAGRRQTLELLISLALAQGRAAEVADKVVETIDLNKLPHEEQFAAVREVQVAYSTSGNERGVNLDLEVAIALAHKLVAMAQTPDERGIALNYLGVALRRLGERESGASRLEAAVKAYQEALKEWTQERVPMDWAMTQNNLGAALRTLGERENGTSRLEAAVNAYQEALKERTLARVPLQWATTQNNLGNALARLGEREGDTAKLEAAVTAFQEALKEWTQERVPLQWATTQNNLGNALGSLGAREGDTAKLEAAVTAYQEALKERTQARVPLQWAGTQNNLGTALARLAERTGDKQKLQEAMACFKRALEEFTPEASPYDYQNTLENLALAEAALAKLAGAP